MIYTLTIPTILLDFSNSTILDQFLAFIFNLGGINNHTGTGYTFGLDQLQNSLASFPTVPEIICIYY